VTDDEGDDEGDDETRSTGIPLWVALGVALAILVAIRLFTINSVFRGGDVVLLSNDPFALLYTVERALTDGTVSYAPADVNWGEPLLTLTLAFLSLLLGGVDRAPLVLALYPVVTTIISGLLVFVLTRLLTDDVRIGLAAVVVLAVTPLHASRTALGFADHHAFDYMWLILTATALTWLVVRTDADDQHRWAVGGVLGLAVAGQALAWEASPLMLVPTAGALGVALPIVFRNDDPTRTLGPIVAGFGLGAVLTQLGHQTLAWHSAVVAGTPVLLFVGGLVLLGLTWAVDRAERSWPTLLGGEFAAAALVAAFVLVVAPDFVGEALNQAEAFNAYIETRSTSGIGETAPLTEAFGPVLGPVILLGFSPFLGLPAAAWGLLRGWRHREPAWFVLAVYVAWFLALAFVQRRWAVQLGLFLSVFAGVGFVAFAHWLALMFPSMFFHDEEDRSDQQTLEPPDRTRLALLSGLGAVGIGGGALYSRFILSEISIDDAAYEAAAWIRDYSDERGLTYPQNYVFTEWGRVRMYNYVVNGESRSYSFAQDNYEDFIFSGDGAAWYKELQGRVGFVVTRDIDSTSPFRIHTRLHRQYGSASGTIAGLGHYRALWESADGSARVFRLVAGATLTGEGPPETRLTLSTPVILAGTGRTVEYQRRVETDASGAFSVTLAQPGEYEVAGGDTSEMLIIDEAAVQDGAELTVRL
jgi:dolichyl-diphosphooligosaccharide--protein glycosyltransferase